MSKPYRREQILAEWRGLDYHPPKRDATVTVADVIGKLMASLGLRMSTWLPLMKIWPSSGA